MDKCPVCHCKIINNRCNHCHYGIDPSFNFDCSDKKRENRKENVLFSWLINPRNRAYEEFPVFYYGVPVAEHNGILHNVENMLKDYPNTLIRRVDEILLNMVTLNVDMGSYFMVSSDDARMMYCETDDFSNEISYIIKMMEELNYIVFTEDTLDSTIYHCQITLNGWQRVEELRKEKKETNLAFIAMKFGEKTKEMAEHIKNAIRQMGYEPYKMDEIEHNNQIVPEMFYAISRSKFFVIDVTIPNLGAYYEAGYAQALGKEVIVCCRKVEEKTAHFDISQKNMILWNDGADLEEKLKKRIEATVGVGLINISNG